MREPVQQFIVQRFLRAHVRANDPDAFFRHAPRDNRAKAGARRLGDVLEKGVFAGGDLAEFRGNRAGGGDLVEKIGRTPVAPA